MNIGTKQTELDKARAEHEARVSELMTKAGLPPVTITTEDRLRGAILSAITEIELGHANQAWRILRESIGL